jgi:hypothetical protein
MDAPGMILDVILNLIAGSRLVRAAAIWSERKGECPDNKGFGMVNDPSEYTVGAYEGEFVAVSVGLVASDPPRSSSMSDSLQLLTELLAQLLGQFITAERLYLDNEAVQKQLFLDREALQLRRAMERARALLARYGSMTGAEATDYLVSVSVRTGRPLLEVAERIVLAYGGPHAGFRWPNRAHPATRHAVA